MALNVAGRLKAGVAVLGAGLVPDKIGHLKRFPFLLLFDTSSSTSLNHGQNPPDIQAIAEALPQIFDALKNPPPNSPLAAVKDQIDLAVMTYNAKTDELLPWSLVSELPTSLPTPPTADGTFTSEMIDTLAPFVAEQGPGKLYLQWASYLAQFPSNDHDDRTFIVAHRSPTA